MSYFDGCENCGIDFPKRQYVFAWCEKCLTTITCRGCGNFMTMTDHRESLYHDECMSCFGIEQSEELERIKIRNEETKAIESEFSNLSDSELEAKWQSSADQIGMYALASWNCKKEEEQKFRDLAEEAQKRQGRIQDEITRRH